MTTDMIDVEPLLGQYDPGMIFVGPLLSLSMNSIYRYFYIAGNGSRVYQSIALGFVDDETNAQRQYAEVIEKLKTRFEEMLTFDSQLEMALVVHTRWPNEETARFLAFAELEAKSEPTKSQHENFDFTSYMVAPPGDDGNQRVNEVAQESVDYTQDTDVIATHAPTLARDQGQPMPVAQSSQPMATPIQPLSDERVAAKEQRNFGQSQDNIALAVLRLKSSAVPESVPMPRVDGSRHWPSNVLRYCAFGSAMVLVAAVVAWAIVHPYTRQVTDVALPTSVSPPSISVSRNEDPSPALAVVPRSVPDMSAEANQPALQTETASAPPPPEPSQVASAQDKTKPVSAPEPTQVASAQDEAKPVSAPEPTQVESAQDEAMPVSALESSRVASAQDKTKPVSAPEPTQVASAQDEAKPVSAPEPTQVESAQDEAKPVSAPEPSQVASAQDEAKPVSAPEPSKAASAQEEARPVSAPEPSQVASAQDQAKPVSEPRSTPTRDVGTALRLDDEEITMLVNRGADSLKNGDLASARLLLRRAAEAGSARAALMLGTTFDPLSIQQLGAIGIVPDVARARQWYEKAAELGSDVASQRLDKLAHSGL